MEEEGGGGGDGCHCLIVAFYKLHWLAKVEPRDNIRMDVMRDISGGVEHVVTKDKGVLHLITPNTAAITVSFIS